MTAEEVIQELAVNGLQARHYSSLEGTMIEVRIGNTNDSIVALMPLHEDIHGMFMLYLVAAAREIQNDPAKLEGVAWTPPQWKPQKVN